MTAEIIKRPSAYPSAQRSPFSMWFSGPEAAGVGIQETCHRDRAAGATIQMTFHERM